MDINGVLKGSGDTWNTKQRYNLSKRRQKNRGEKGRIDDKIID